MIKLPKTEFLMAYISIILIADIKKFPVLDDKITKNRIFDGLYKHYFDC